MNGDIHILSLLRFHAAKKNSVMFFEVLERVDAFVALLDSFWLQSYLLMRIFAVCCKEYTTALELMRILKRFVATDLIAAKIEK